MTIEQRQKRLAWLEQWFRTAHLNANREPDWDGTYGGDWCIPRLGSSQAVEYQAEIDRLKGE